MGNITLNHISNSNFNWYVHIIESPSSVNLLDGRTEGKILTEALNLAGIQNSYNLVTNSETLNTAIYNKLCQSIEKYKALPILHFSMHGNKTGLSLTNGEHINWQRLKDLLLPINKHMDDTLILSISSCEGFNGFQMAMGGQAYLPFKFLIGNVATTLWSDAAVAFVSFYHRLFKGATIEDAVNAMKIASGDNNFCLANAKHAQEFWKNEIKKQELVDKLREALERIIKPQK